MPNKVETLKHNVTTMISAQTYLTQSLGSDLGYRFIWNKGHVVSTKLEEDSNNGEKWSTDTEVSKSGALHHVGIVQELEKQRPKSGIDKIAWYQMLADIVYISRHPEDFKIDDVTADALVNTYSKKTKITKLCVRIAVNVLIQKGFLDLHELHEE